jgi:hypothetical protein
MEKESREENRAIQEPILRLLNLQLQRQRNGSAENGDVGAVAAKERQKTISLKLYRINP